MTMKPQIKAGWVDDLRSGKFPQTTGKLVGPALIENPTDSQREAWIDHPDNDGDSTKDPGVRGYCCLGVLTERAITSGDLSSIIRWDPDDEFAVEVWMNPDGEFPETPSEAHGDGDWVEFTDNDLPGCVAHWAGITDKRPDDDAMLAIAVTEEQRREVLPMTNNPRIGARRAIDRNDKMRQTFAEIADAVEQDKYL